MERITRMDVNLGLIDTRSTLVGKEVTPISQAVGIVLSGGLGTRMDELTRGKLPKQILPLVKGGTVLDNPVVYMREAGIQTIWIVTQDITHDALKSNTKRRHNYDGINYFVEDSPPKGTLFAIQSILASEKIGAPIIKANGDEAFVSVDLKSLYEFHSLNGNSVSCMLTDDSEGSEKYRFRIDQSGKVTGVREASVLPPLPDEYSETGLWIIDPSQFGLLNTCSYWSEFMKEVIRRGLLYGYPTHSKFFNINTPQDLNRAQLAFNKK